MRPPFDLPCKLNDHRELLTKKQHNSSTFCCKAILGVFLVASHVIELWQATHSVDLIPAPRMSLYLAAKWFWSPIKITVNDLFVDRFWWSRISVLSQVLFEHWHCARHSSGEMDVSRFSESLKISRHQTKSSKRRRRSSRCSTSSILPRHWGCLESRN